MNALEPRSDFDVDGFFELLDKYLGAIEKDQLKPDHIINGLHQFDFEKYLDKDFKTNLAKEGIHSNVDINWNFFGLMKMATGFIAQTIGVALLVSSRFAGEPFMDRVAKLKSQDFKFLLSVFGANIKGLVDKFIVTQNINGILAHPRDLSPSNYTRGVVFRQGLGCTLVFDDQQIQNIQEQPSMVEYTPEDDYCLLGDLRLVSEHDSLPPIDEVALEIAVTKMFELDAGKSKGTQAVIVVYQGQIVKEMYDNRSFAQTHSLSHLQGDIEPNTPLMGWSMTKSVTNAILGVMIYQGKFGDFQQFSAERRLVEANITDAQIVEDFLKTIKVKDYLNYPSLVSVNPNHEITLDDLLRMSSGLRWTEGNFKYDVMEMVYGESDMAAYVANKGISKPPGQRHNYSSGDTNLIATIIKESFIKEADSNDLDPLKAYWSFPHQNLFTPLGMCNTILQVDPAGTFVGSSYCIASARDWARFGVLFLNDGVIKKTGQRLLPPGWVDYSKSLKMKSNGKPLVEHYGAHFWINKPTAADLLDRKKKTGILGVDKEMFYARGLFGQRVYVVPNKDLVVVRIGTRDKVGLKKFLRGIVDAF